MAWTQHASIKGPQGDPGDPGAPGPAPEIRVNGGYVQWREEGGEWANLIAVDDLKGADGADGTSVTIVGSVEGADDLPDDLGPGDAGDGYITEDDGHLHVWSGTGWTDVGEIRGPQGPAGADGADGSDGAPGAPGDPGPRGATWFTGQGSPGSIGGQLVGDLYLDTDTGVVYRLEA